MAEYKSKTVTVNATAKQIFDKAIDFQGLVAAVPEDRKQYIRIEDGMLCLEYAGFCVKIKVAQMTPFSKIVYADAQAPFHFTVTLEMEPAEIITQTLLTATVDADLNLMMKMMLGGKIQEYLDMIMSAVSTGQFLR